MKVTFSKLAGDTGLVNTPVAISATPRCGSLCTLVAADTNTDNIIIGPDNSADFYKVAPGQAYNLPGSGIPSVSVDLAAWYVQSATATQAWKIIYVPLSDS